MVITSLIIVLLIVAGILYYNFNRLLSEALMRSFNSSLASDVYELRFEKLRVNLFEGDIQVFDVVIQPRERPSKNYAYINSSIRLTTEELTLKKVEIRLLLQSSKLVLESILIRKPDIDAVLSGEKPILLPFEQSPTLENPEVNEKRTIESFSLREFQLVDANFHLTNKQRQRVFKISKFNVSLKNLLIDQRPGEDVLSFDRVELSMSQFEGSLKKEAVQHVDFEGFRMGIDSLSLRMTLDTLIFRLHDFNAGLRALNVQTADSLFHLTVQSFNISYKEKLIQLDSLSFMPNISNAALQHRFKYQHTQVSGQVNRIVLSEVDFNGLRDHQSLSIGEVVVTNPIVSIYKDNTKPVDSARVPQYFGQQIKAIPIPVIIRKISARDVHLTNVERKPDGSDASVTITRGNVLARNITNQSPTSLDIDVDAYINNKVHFEVHLAFSYQKPTFKIKGRLEKFALPDLNPMIMAYTPAKINKGVAEQITFESEMDWTKSEGAMTFLYDDLEIDLDLKEKAKWKSSVLAFVANSVIHTRNPNSATLPSVLSGIKETLIMSKENEKSYKDAKKKARQSKKEQE